jgi:hypothetical protein
LPIVAVAPHTVKFKEAGPWQKRLGLPPHGAPASKNSRGVHRLDVGERLVGAACPLWVISGRDNHQRSRPFCNRKRTRRLKMLIDLERAHFNVSTFGCIEQLLGRFNVTAWALFLSEAIQLTRDRRGRKAQSYAA